MFVPGCKLIAKFPSTGGVFLTSRERGGYLYKWAKFCQTAHHPALPGTPPEEGNLSCDDFNHEDDRLRVANPREVPLADS